ncbi:pre-peptidase C-terminal domain-containing protein [Bifidobacterium simiarum]|uniref:pre-peptidase C-terminal domain-containing protein n=1 Tax=Bifidobacterium simiarum TaxID=2045441 RepID=UPI001BDBBACF|nr:pre-peptidase C-terminal domain-containing protein [Bifidobacterium simiarum]MBT1167038.1 hypothetical protein [Bifidobacterium simiarum]
MRNQHTPGRWGAWGRLAVAAIVTVGMFAPISVANAAEAETPAAEQTTQAQADQTTQTTQGQSVQSEPVQVAPAQSTPTASAQPSPSAQSAQSGEAAASPIAGNASARNNTSMSRAVAIQVNRMYDLMDGSKSGTDVWFKFAVTRPGVINVQGLNERHMYPSLLDSSGRVLFNNPDLLGSKTSLGNIGVAAGTYYLKIATFSWYGKTSGYTLKVGYSATSNWETEWNNDRASADVLTLGRTLNGSVWGKDSDGEQDWYRFTLSKATKVQIALRSAPVAGDYYDWVARVYAPNLSQIAAYTWKGSQNGRDGVMTLAHGTYYIRVTYSRYFKNYGDRSGAHNPMTYTVSVRPWTVMKVPVYRVYNRRSGLHHYTRNASERNMLVSLGWRNEGTSFITVPGNTSGAKPVYREYNRRTGNHNWTMNKKEHDMLVRLGWKNEGVSWYAPSSGKNVYRLYNRHSGEHVYTMSYGEYVAVQRAGWKGEGVAWKSL